jgi:two-component system, OmpR family, phosphate regulon sensor histidine kinase PhoR
MKKGAFDFISKPFSPQDLRTVTGKAIEYIRTLEDIAHEKSRMGVLINHISDGVMATDMQRRVALANPAFLKMIGHKGESAIGKPVTDLIRNESLLQVIDKALSMPAEEFGEVTEEFAEGALAPTEETVIAVRCVPFRDRLHRNLGTVTVMHDITALKKMDQMKSDFVSMVAHEIKSPMNSVLALVKVIQDGLAGDLTEKQQEMLGRISEKIKGLADLSAELLDLARIESGLITMEKERLQLEPLLREQVSFSRGESSKQAISPQPRSPARTSSGIGEQALHRRSHLNLITNAIRYTPEGGSMTLSGGVEKDYVRISVKDTGFGIGKEDQDRIFERFYRVKNDQTRFITGTGLGLAIVKSIVDAHNGMIKVESEAGRGSTFHVHSPHHAHLRGRLLFFPLRFAFVQERVNPFFRIFRHAQRGKELIGVSKGFAVFQVGHAVKSLLSHLEGQRALFRQFVCKGHGFLVQPIQGHHLVYQAPSLRIACVDHVAGHDHLQASLSC